MDNILTNLISILVSLVFPPVIFYYQKMKRKYRSSVLKWFVFKD